MLGDCPVSSQRSGRMKPSKNVYLGIGPDGKMQLVYSDDKLSPVGPRLLRNNDFPKAVYDFYQQDNSASKSAIMAMEGFFRGEEVVGEKLEFGQTIKTKRKKQ